MKKIVKTMLGITGLSAMGIIGYSIINKNVRKKAMDLKDTMLDEAQDMLKK